MRRALDRIGQGLAKLAGAAAGVFLALALGIGAQGGAMEIYYAASHAPLSPSCKSYLSGLEEACLREEANLADAEMNLPFDSGASTSSDHQLADGNDLVRFLSIRPVIGSAPGGQGFLRAR